MGHGGGVGPAQQLAGSQLFPGPIDRTPLCEGRIRQEGVRRQLFFSHKFLWAKPSRVVHRDPTPENKIIIGSIEIKASYSCSRATPPSRRPHRAPAGGHRPQCAEGPGGPPPPPAPRGGRRGGWGGRADPCGGAGIRSVGGVCGTCVGEDALNGGWGFVWVS